MSFEVAYKVDESIFIHGKVEEVLKSNLAEPYKRQVDLIFFSPPFPLNRKKKYGNLQGTAYLEWFAELAPMLKEFLSPTGSIVVEVGNSWEPGRPVMSTLAIEALLSFLKRGELTLCQQFVWYNTAKLPTPAQWVNVKRIRVKDSFTHIWWMAATDNPKANNKNVLVEYSAAMKTLLRTKKYNSGKRPSEHNVGKTSFLTNNEGAIPSSVLSMANTRASSNYLTYCKTEGIRLHPARMPIGLPEFFIKFLTEPGDLVLDPFAGSGTTCEAAERLDRRWIGIEANKEYIDGSKGRFIGLQKVIG
ncbi:DNA-methyltransferase [Rhodocaloribacter sp.]